MSLLFALDFQKRSAARVQKINLKACPWWFDLRVWCLS
jgi:hypothetical protein